MSRLLVLLDCDGLLADFVAGYAAAAARVTGRPADRALVDRWDIAAALGLSPDERDAVHRMIRERDWCAALGVLPGAREAVAAIREVADVHVVTTPWDGSLFWCGERLAWLREHFGFAPEDVTFTHRKDLVRGDVLVDDKPEHVLAWAKAHPRGAGMLFDTPQNRHALLYRTDWPLLLDWLTLCKEARC